MRRPRYLTFDCPDCGHAEERFVETNDDNTPLEPAICGYTDMDASSCRAEMQPRDFGGPPLVAPINKRNSDYAERERARLMQRSNDHWKREGRHEARERAKKYDPTA